MSFDATHCTLCPRRCGADREKGVGLCHCGTEIRIASSPAPMGGALHFRQTWFRNCVLFRLCSGLCILPEPENQPAGCWKSSHSDTACRDFSEIAGTAGTQYQSGHRKPLYTMDRAGSGTGKTQAAHSGGVELRRL